MALEKFCLCCKLRNGVVIFGVMNIIWNLILWTVTVSSDISFDRIQKNIIYDDSIGYGASEYNATIPDWRPTTLFWTSVVILVIDLISSILLIIGAVKVPEFRK